MAAVLGCAPVHQASPKERTAATHLKNAREFLAQGIYEGTVRECERVLALYGNAAPGDEALFTLGLVYADTGNPRRDNRRSLAYFRRVAEAFPRSPRAPEAKVWIGVLTAMGRATEVDLEIEEKKKELGR